MSEYKVGDRVWVHSEVLEVDRGDANLPIRVQACAWPNVGDIRRDEPAPPTGEAGGKEGVLIRTEDIKRVRVDAGITDRAVVVKLIGKANGRYLAELRFALDAARHFASVLDNAVEAAHKYHAESSVATGIDDSTEAL